MARTTKMRAALSLWISAMLKMKQSFMLLSNNVISVDVTVRKHKTPSSLLSVAKNNASFGRTKPLLGRNTGTAVVNVNSQ